MLIFELKKTYFQSLMRTGAFHYLEFLSCFLKALNEILASKYLIHDFVRILHFYFALVFKNT